VQPDLVVEANNVVGNILSSFGLMGVVLVPDARHFQAQKELFHDTVVPTVALATHTGLNAMALEPIPVKLAGVLAATIAVRDQMRAYPPWPMASRRASPTHSAGIDGAMAQPTIFLEKRSLTAARYSQPDRVRM
jgi:hypothetical protein